MPVDAALYGNRAAPSNMCCRRTSVRILSARPSKKTLDRPGRIRIWGDPLRATDGLSRFADKIPLQLAHTLQRTAYQRSLACRGGCVLQLFNARITNDDRRQRPVRDGEANCRLDELGPMPLSHYSLKQPCASHLGRITSAPDLLPHT